MSYLTITYAPRTRFSSRWFKGLKWAERVISEPVIGANIREVKDLTRGSYDPFDQGARSYLKHINREATKEISQ